MKIHVTSSKRGILHRLRYVNRFSEKTFEVDPNEFSEDFYYCLSYLEACLAKGFIDKIQIERVKDERENK